MRKSLCAAVMIGVMIITVCACGFKDIDNRFFVIAVGIDQGKAHMYKISLMLDIPHAKTQPGESRALVVSNEADTIAEAVRQLKSKVDKELDFGQCKIFIIGKSFAKAYEMSKSIDWIYRRRDIQQIANIAIGEPDAETVLNANPMSERIRGNALILALSGDGTESPYIVKEPIFDLFRRMHSHGINAYMPIVRSEEKSLVIDRVMIFKDTRAKLELTPEETASFNQIARSYKRFIIKTKVDGNPVTFSGTNLQVRYRFAPSESDPTEVRFHIRAEADLEDAATELYEMNWNKIEQIVAEQLKSEYESLLLKLQEHGVDPIGLGIRYRADNHKRELEIEKWKKIYPRLRFNVNVRVFFKSTGIIE